MLAVNTTGSELPAAARAAIAVRLAGVEVDSSTSGG